MSGSLNKVMLIELGDDIKMVNFDDGGCLVDSDCNE